MFKSSRDWKLYVQDIFDECKNIRVFTKDIDYETFSNNLEKVYATAKAFENIGEAVKNIPKEVTNEFPSIPWSEVAKMRDILTHHYFGVDDKILWDSLEDDFGEFEDIIEQIIKKYC